MARNPRNDINDLRKPKDLDRLDLDLDSPRMAKAMRGLGLNA